MSYSFITLKFPYFISVTFPVLIIDQVTKAWFFYCFTRSEKIEIISGLLNIRFVINTELYKSYFNFLKFEIGSNQVQLFIVIQLVVIFVIIFILLKYFYTKVIFPQIGLYLILAGSIGNSLDRLSLFFPSNGVVDFIEIILFRSHIINVADIAISVGSFLFAIGVLFIKNTDALFVTEKK